MDSFPDEVRLLFEGVAPERKEEIGNLFGSGVCYERVNDRPGFYIQTFDRVVLCNDRSLFQVYLIAFMSWKALIEQSGAIFVFDLLNQPYDEGLLRDDPGHSRFENDVDELAASVKALGEVAQLDQFVWPANVPRPLGETPKFQDVEDKLSFELALFALAYILLHETRHAMFAVDGDAPGGMDEERICDAYASAFLLDNISTYATGSGDPAHKVATKRALGLLVAQATILELTPHNRWNASGEHPPVAERIFATFNAMKLPPGNPAWVFASSMMLARLRRSGRSIGRTPFQNPRDLCEKVCQLIR